MKKLYSLYGIIVFTSVIIWLTGCKGKDEKDIQGVWKIENVGDLSSKYVETWTFKQDGGPLYFYLSPDSASGRKFAIYDTCRYYLNARLRETYVHIENCTKIPWYNGDWQIIHLNSSIMVIVRNSPLSPEAAQASGNSGSNAGLMTREFTKE